MKELSEMTVSELEELIRRAQAVKDDLEGYLQRPLRVKLSKNCKFTEDDFLSSYKDDIGWLIRIDKDDFYVEFEDRFGSSRDETDQWSFILKKDDLLFIDTHA